MLNYATTMSAFPTNDLNATVMGSDEDSTLEFYVHESGVVSVVLVNCERIYKKIVVLFGYHDKVC